MRQPRLTGAAGPVGVTPPSRAVAGQTSRATTAIEANGSRWPPPRCGIDRYRAPAVAETLSSPSDEVRCGSRWAAMPAAATAVAVPEPKPPIIAPMTTSGTDPARAAQPYPTMASTSPIRAGRRGL